MNKTQTTIKNVKVISFDVWGTLIKGNPKFKDWRTECIATALGWSGNLNDAEILMREVDVSIDKKADQTGQDFDFSYRVQEIEKEMALVEARKTGFLTKVVRDNSFYARLEEKVCEGFLEQLPALIEPDIAATVARLRAAGFKVALSSNTGFINGKTMRMALGKLGLFKHVNYAVFSNELGVAKPNALFFEHLSKVAGVPAESILHVGDNLEADYAGASKYGIKPMVYGAKDKLADTYPVVSKMAELPALIFAANCTAPHSTLALHHLVAPGKRSKKILTEKGLAFDAKSYSRFKYGNGEIAFRYGIDLARKFIAKHKSLLAAPSKETDFVVTTSPYKFIPKGSSGIVRGFVSYMNAHLLKIGKNPLVDVKILKDKMFEGDYGNFTEEERLKITRGSKLFVPLEYVKNKKIIIIDDMRITGSHERNLLEFFSDKDVQEIFFLYVATMDQEYAAKLPQIEHTLNHAWMNKPEKLKKEMSSKNFLLNARVCKYILSIEDKKVLEDFLCRLNLNVLKKLRDAIVGDGYASMPIYADSFRVLEKALKGASNEHKQ